MCVYVRTHIYILYIYFIFIIFIYILPLFSIIHIYIFIYVYIYMSVVLVLWLIISARSELSSPLHRSSTLSPILRVFYIFGLFHPPFLPPPSPSIPLSFAYKSPETLCVSDRASHAKCSKKVLSISVTGIPYEHARLIDRRTESATRQRSFPSEKYVRHSWHRH